ncbi:hypothetical protein B0H13DRAFT_2311283 [Mycena leptocephala]|nr:hypothetical protein B0H13DRAFT_2311283 [Mycena leptocephala]
MPPASGMAQMTADQGQQREKEAARRHSDLATCQTPPISPVFNATPKRLFQHQLLVLLITPATPPSSSDYPLLLVSSSSTNTRIRRLAIVLKRRSDSLTEPPLIDSPNFNSRDDPDAAAPRKGARRLSGYSNLATYPTPLISPVYKATPKRLVRHQPPIILATLATPPSPSDDPLLLVSSSSTNTRSHPPCEEGLYTTSEQYRTVPQNCYCLEQEARFPHKSSSRRLTQLPLSSRVKDSIR